MKTIISEMLSHKHGMSFLSMKDFFNISKVLFIFENAVGNKILGEAGL